MVMVSSFATELVLMLAFILALQGCMVATTHRSVSRTEGRFDCFCSTSRYIRTKLHPVQLGVGVLLLLESFAQLGIVALQLLDAGMSVHDRKVPITNGELCLPN